MDEPEVAVEWPALSPHDAWRKLAIAVLRQAVVDATRTVDLEPRIANLNGRRQHRELIRQRDQARQFLLQCSEPLAFWCELAGLDPEAVADAAKKIARNWERHGQLLRKDFADEDDEDTNVIPLRPTSSIEEDIDVTFELLNLREAS